MKLVDSVKISKSAPVSFEEGVEVSMLVAINVYSLQEDKTAKIVRYSTLDDNIMHLNLYENHFSYIKKFKSYAQKYTCSICGRILSKACNLKKHMKNLIAKWKRGTRLENNVTTILMQGIKVPPRSLRSLLCLL